MKSFFYSILETAEVALVAIITVLVIRNFLVQPFLVSGASMEPNFSSGDYLLIDEITYAVREPQRGEVIVFHYPKDESTYYIKRIIGLPGETVGLDNGKITIFNNEFPNGFSLGENYLPVGTQTSSEKKIILKNTEYFVLGDNRSASFDSRSWGNLDKKEIVGVVRLRLWPVNKVMAFERPVY